MARASEKLRRPERRSLKIRLLGGLVLWVSTLYCGPVVRTGKGRGRDGGGLYPQLAAWGFSKGVSPALVSTVARCTALLPSFELARRELSRRGGDLDIKAVHRISKQLGTEMLTTRQRDLVAWREGRLAAGGELAGKRIGVAIDGGRLRLREHRRRQKGQGKHKTRRRRYSAAWREPKLLIIFELDEQGRMKRSTRPWIDATLQGPDQLMEWLAFHLHRLGAAQARTVAFVSDGAPWIWERLDQVQRRVGLAAEKTHRILDWCHAVHHVSLALENLKLTEPVRERIFHRLRHNLRAGRVHRVVDELNERAKGKRRDHEVWREIEYLNKHSPHMQYKQLRQSGLPMGSGAIESAIRRVVNQRLKGNGIMWLKENAEAMLVLRAAALTDRWDESLEHVRATMAQSRRLDWQWPSAGISTKLKPTAAPTAQDSQALHRQQDLAMQT